MRMETKQESGDRIILEGTSGKTGKYKLYVDDGCIIFDFYCIFDESTDEDIHAVGKMRKEDYAAGIKELSQTGYCKIPLSECRQDALEGYLEMRKKNGVFIINFQNYIGFGQSIHNQPTDWTIDDLLGTIDDL